MNCLLTGANGFLGKIISNQISDSNKIWTLSRNGSDFIFFLEKEIPDFTLKFDLVIHAAGKAHSVPKTELEKEEFYKVNVVGTQNLLEGLTKSGIPKYFVFISSVSVYGKDFGSDIDEKVYLGALDPYGISKIEAERIVLDWCKQHHVVCTILRLPLIVGPNPPGNLGAMIKGIQKGYYFNIAGGKAQKSMVLAEDVAKSILKAAEVGGIYNLTDGYHPSFAELSNHISIQLGKGKPMHMPMWLASIIANFGGLLGSKAPLNTNKLKKITSDLTFDDTKAREAFGWNPKRVLEGFKINTNAQ
jgi:nucleoside-diphosphate-sugar epimerase